MGHTNIEDCAHTEHIWVFLYIKNLLQKLRWDVARGTMDCGENILRGLSGCYIVLLLFLIKFPSAFHLLFVLDGEAEVDKTNVSYNKGVYAEGEFSRLLINNNILRLDVTVDDSILAHEVDGEQ